HFVETIRKIDALLTGDMLHTRCMCGEDLNVDPRVIHCSDAARADFGKTSIFEEQPVVQHHQLTRGKGLLRADKWQVLVSRRDVRILCRGGACFYDRFHVRFCSDVCVAQLGCVCQSAKTSLRIRASRTGAWF